MYLVMCLIIRGYYMAKPIMNSILHDISGSKNLTTDYVFHNTSNAADNELYCILQNQNLMENTKLKRSITKYPCENNCCN